MPELLLPGSLAFYEEQAMKKIGLLSDTHGYFHKGIVEFFQDVDEIWHAGDFGSMEVIEQLEEIAPLRGVYGNIDDASIRTRFPEDNLFIVEGARIYIRHIGGYPGKYQPGALKTIINEQPDLFISGHSHILKVMNDKQRNLLHMNPGAAGKAGFHKKITALRFKIREGRFEHLEVFEAPRAGT